MIRTVAATRYVTPLREGGSLPGLVEADDDGLYVVKFRGAGQGPKALVAELVAGELARAIGLSVPEIVFDALTFVALRILEAGADESVDPSGLLSTLADNGTLERSVELATDWLDDDAAEAA